MPTASGVQREARAPLRAIQCSAPVAPSQLTRIHGHKAGKHVLSHVAAVLKATARQSDLVCRLGGEEFVVIALDTDSTGAQQLAERMRAASSPGKGRHPSAAETRRRNRVEWAGVEQSVQIYGL
ncbi:hypothetical protein O203_09890 [Ectopseudomonas chengduensis]|nr:diguanylate cyclase [Pseudomonas chengduensis]ERH50837.1 hypothetical protein O203_09890 [Pseudomonas chengduensis]